MKVTESDFRYLWNEATKVCDNTHEHAKDGRFADPEKHESIKINEKAHVTYWFENYASIVLARHFLESNGYLCQIGLDEWSEDVFGAIFTDYKGDFPV